MDDEIKILRQELAEPCRKQWINLTLKLNLIVGQIALQEQMGHFDSEGAVVHVFMVAKISG